ncbi:MAG: hypothetical protein KGS28_16050, partial [Betaproteobacteria bacterium]|nr:hypothetical protein [Betaproteobacteria bacterium]
MKPRLSTVLPGGLLLALALTGAAAHDMPMHPGSMPPEASSALPAAPRADGRAEVRFPPELRREVLATMRMHLQGL